MFCPNRQCPDLRRSGIPGEYRDGIDRCPRCGSALVAERPQPPGEPEEPSVVEGFEEFVSVLRIRDGSVVPLVKSLLQSAGVRHFVKNERTHELMGYPRLSSSGYHPFLGQPEVMVEPSRAEEARELLAGLEPSPPEPVEGDSR